MEWKIKGQQLMKRVGGTGKQEEKEFEKRKKSDDRKRKYRDTVQ